MILLKAPWWRVAGWELVAPEIQSKAISDLERLVAALPFGDEIEEIEIVGSYARMRAMLHSDIDVRLRLPAGSADRHMVQAQVNAWARLRKLIEEDLGIRMDVYVRPGSEIDRGKQAFLVRAGVWANKNAGDVKLDRITYIPATGQWETSRRTIGKLDIAGGDPWADEVATWQSRYGRAFQAWGSTEDTAWARST